MHCVDTGANSLLSKMSWSSQASFTCTMVHNELEWAKSYERESVCVREPAGDITWDHMTPDHDTHCVQAATWSFFSVCVVRQVKKNHGHQYRQTVCLSGDQGGLYHRFQISGITSCRWYDDDSASHAQWSVLHGVTLCQLLSLQWNLANLDPWNQDTSIFRTHIVVSNAVFAH